MVTGYTSQPSLFTKEPKGSQSRPVDLPTFVMRYLWKCLQEGVTEVIVEDTQIEFGATAQQVSKAVRRFNETGHKRFWPGFHFSARVLDVYRIAIRAEQENVLK